MASDVRSQLLNSLFGPRGLWRAHFPGDEYQVSGRNSGSEGMELALRLVFENRFDSRRLTLRPGQEERRVILTFEGAWHGWTPGVLSVINRRHFKIGLPGFDADGPFGFEARHLPFGDEDLLAAFFKQEGHSLAAVVVEPVQGDAGIIVPPPGYLRTLARLCEQYGALLVADEVLTFAKTGKFFALADDDGPIKSDITVIGKSLGMGILSTSMVIARRSLSVRSCGAVSTSDLRPLTCAVIAAGLKHLVAERLLDAPSRLGPSLRQDIEERLVRRFPEIYREVRGSGFLNGIELTERGAHSVNRLRASLIDCGVFVELMAGAGPRSGGMRYLFPTVRIAPPLITSPEDLSEIVSRMAKATAAMTGSAV
jgi:ornithine--oxo-acid transaminase